ncbi:MAG: DUF3368 domain-containing protein [Betaproteobacteria bacterium]|nr:DUF3368 domain-containing protein [Betaproteobacteria bacterium]
MAEKRLVLSDSSPLIALAAAGGFGLLRELFGVVSVTRPVRDEVLAGGEKAGATDLRRVLGAALASGGDCYLLIDDESARREARARGLEFAGTLGVLIVAKHRGFIPAVRPFLARLVEYGFHLSPELGQSVLVEAGEHR